ncbi:hypothetical protein Gbem_3495 [Citrifermentans bemidjiense Bem]|uniref:Uncharacterized protein n=1 Tax=Citrifermentans bemidjiense (strain ATCC BAA-1014 / DSM 16622 / JCM 12645 / Bem) TaxID=404380 RepID=B5EC32_CITBB|nr:hypothetical protein Gbem_3495 [Citrifermentans bemidjiense Bem]
MTTSEIDLAAAILTSTGLQPTLNRPITGLQTFTFPDSPEVISAVTRFACDDLCLPAKRLLSIRGFLYRQLRAGRTK